MGDIELILKEASAYGMRVEVEALAEELLRHFPDDFVNDTEAYQKAYEGLCETKETK
tara:strand:+ start:721 stop:891 length:171 start_codon:yes stop_codon:yes gene_type:complete